MLAVAAGGVAALAALATHFISLDISLRQPGATRAVLLPAPAPTDPAWTPRLAVLAGSGLPGAADGPAPQSRFSDPYGLALDLLGNVYVADAGDSNRIRKIATDGTVSTIAGAHEGFADGTGAAAAFDTPSSIAFDRRGNLYVADTGNHAIRKMAPDGTVSTVAGDGKPGFADGKGRAARFNGPVGIAVDREGVVYVADTYNDRIRRIAPDGTVSTIAGDGRPGMADGPALAAGFDTPSALAVARDGTLYIADTGNNAIRRLGPDGMVTTDPPPLDEEVAAMLRRPVGLALTHDGYLYVSAASGGRILLRAPDGSYRPVRLPPGSVPAGHPGDGTIRLHGPRALAPMRDGSLVVADADALRVHRLSTAAGGTAVPPAPAQARVERMPWPLSPQSGPHEVVGVLGEVRGSYDGESRHHFHAGLDIRGDVGTPVLAITRAKVSDPFPNWGFDTLSEGISIGPISYIHMRVGRDARGRPLDPRFDLLEGPRGKPVRVRVQRGTRFEPGDRLGTVNRMAHVHLEYYPSGAALNPLALPFPGLRDTVDPRIESIAIYQDGRVLRRKRAGRLLVPRSAGELSIVVAAYDQMDGNLARRRLGLYKLGYQLLDADGKPLPGYEEPVITQVYDRLPRAREAVKLAYAPSSGITVHGSKTTRFAYALNNTLLGGRAAPGNWNIATLPPGDYRLRIHAADYAGNTAQARDVALTLQ